MKKDFFTYTDFVIRFTGYRFNGFVKMTGDTKKKFDAVPKVEDATKFETYNIAYMYAKDFATTYELENVFKKEIESGDLIIYPTKEV